MIDMNTYKLMKFIIMSQHNLFQASSGVEEKFFKTLKDLIRHYKHKNQGLATHLCRSLKRKTLLDQPLQCAEPLVPNEENDYESKCRLLQFKTLAIMRHCQCHYNETLLDNYNEQE